MNERWDDDFGDDWDDEAEDDDAWTDDDASETAACPACGAEVYEDAVRCPSCGEYITPASGFFAGRPWWWIALGVAGVVAVIVTSLVFTWGL